MNFLKLDKDNFFILIMSIISGFLIYKIIQEHFAFYDHELFSNIVYDEDSNSNGKHSLLFKIFLILYLFYMYFTFLTLSSFKEFGILVLMSGIVCYVLLINFDEQEYRKEALLNKYTKFVNINSGFENTENGKNMLSAANEIDIDKFTKIYAKKLDNIKVNEDSHNETISSIKKLNNNDLNYMYDLYLKDNYLSLKENENLKKEINRLEEKDLNLDLLY